MQSSRPKPQLSSPAASPAQAQTLVVPPASVPINAHSPRPLTPAQPELQDADMASSRTKWRKGSDPLDSRDRTNTSVNLVPVSTPDARRASAPSMTATAYPGEVWNPYEQPPVSPPPLTAVKPGIVPPTTRRNETTAQTATDPYLTCGTCGKTFKERSYLIGHVRASGHEPRTNAKLQKAEASSYPSPSRPSRKTGNPEVRPAQPTQRTQPTQPAKDPYLTCGTCNKTFKSRGQLMDHVATSRHKARQLIDPRLTCLACQKPFGTRSDLFEHLEATGHARDLATGEPEPLKVVKTVVPAGYGGPNKVLEGYYDMPQRVPREELRRGGKKINPGVSPNRMLETHYPTPQHLPREDFRRGGEKIYPGLTCLTCYKRFRDRSSLFNHLERSGHARDLATVRPERYGGSNGLNTEEYVGFDRQVARELGPLLALYQLC